MARSRAQTAACRRCLGTASVTPCATERVVGRGARDSNASTQAWARKLAGQLSSWPGSLAFRWEPNLSAEHVPFFAAETQRRRGG
eukprot:4657832-Prymnesium_polylepis.1